jgi:broad specificity phosphatase PhoE
MRFQPITVGLLASSITTTLALPSKSHTTYFVIPGIFQQDDPATNPSTFNFTASNFGLIPRSYPSDPTCPTGKHSTQWQRLAHYISTLNSQAKHSSERYILFFLGRHGEGYHNAAESYYGTPAWNCYWSERDGNATTTWADANITPKGAEQALAVNAFWKHLIRDEKITPPQTFYTSPLWRCLQTAKLTFEGVNLPWYSPFLPVVKEYFREGISAHTCDRRSSKTDIHKAFPYYRFERGFAENDPLWQELHAEPREDQDIRSKKVVDEVVSSDGGTYISVTSHSGEIASLLRGESSSC